MIIRCYFAGRHIVPLTKTDRHGTRLIRIPYKCVHPISGSHHYLFLPTTVFVCIRTDKTARNQHEMYQFLANLLVRLPSFFFPEFSMRISLTKMRAFRALVILLRIGINKFIIEVKLVLFSVIEIDPKCANHSNCWKAVVSVVVCKMLMRQTTDCFRTRKSNGRKYTHCGNVIFRVFCSIDDFSLSLCLLVFWSSLPKSIER